MKRQVIWLVIVLAVAGVMQMQGVGFAPVRNFSRTQYDAGSQNWSMAQDPLGRVYFGNRDGLLSFDGNRWNLYHLPNYTTVRSVLADDKTGRIFVGGTDEFGYFEATGASNSPAYVSWTRLLPDNRRSFGEIWGIHEIDDGKYAFRGDFAIFLSDGRKASVIPVKQKITASAFIGDRLYVALNDGSIQYLSGNRLIPLPDSGQLAGKRIVSIMPFGNGLMIATASDGLFTYSDGRLSPLQSDISSFLQENQVFSANTSNGLYAFGTVNRGAVVKNFETGATYYINKSTGLQNNTVLGLGFDFSDNLWLCLDNGIDYAMVDSPVLNLLGTSSDAGAGYASLLSGNRLFLGTNRGLFITPYPITDRVSPPALQRKLSGQIWGIDSVGKDIFVSADDGLYISSGSSGEFSKLPGINIGSWYAAPLRNDPSKVLVSTYRNFYLLQKDGSSWRSLGPIAGYDDAGGHFFEDAGGNIWIAHWIKGVYRLRLAPDQKSFSEVKLYTSKDGLPSERENSLALYNGKLKIATATGEFFYPAADGRMVRDEVLTKLIPLKHPAHFYTLPSGMSLTFSPRQVWKMTKDSQGKMIVDSVSLQAVASSLIPGFEHVGFLDRNTMVVSHQEGFFCIDLQDKPSAKWKNPVFVQTLASGDSVIFSGQPKDRVPELKLPYQQNSLTFSFAAPEYRFDKGVLYSYMLENYDKEWSTPGESASKEYTRLSEGDYIFHIRAYNTVTGEMSESSLPFTIQPPWYRTVVAKIIYVLLFLLLIYVGYRLVRRYSQLSALKIRRQKEAEMAMLRKEAEKEAIRKDFEIASLKSEQLEQDIKHKSSELSNITMNVIRKNEILLDISSKLKRLQEKAVTTDTSAKNQKDLNREFDSIQALIRENISHDDDWKKFNQNFDIVYEDFTKRLSELHPDLTVSERRICCYLKMGLSSKDIAPLFNISPKSVEMNRYRLRKKLGLERSDSLTAYLQGI